MYKVALALFILVLLFTGLLGCNGTDFVVPDEVHALAEDLLQAYNIGDYGAYLENFDVNSNKAITSQIFEHQVDFNVSRIGYYVSMSKEVSEVKVTDEYTDVIYKTQFSNEPDDVFVTVAYYVVDGQIHAEGIWFNSPKLFGFK